MGVEAAGDAGVKGRQHERLDLVARGVHARGLGGQLVFPDGGQRPAEAAGHQAVHAEDRQQHQGQDQVIVLQPRAEHVAEERRRRDVHDPERAVGEAHPVLQHQEEDHVEPERHQRQVNARQPQRGLGDEVAEEAGDRPRAPARASTHGSPSSMDSLAEA